MTLLVTKAPVASARMTRRSGAAARPVTRAAASSAPSPAQHRPEARQDALSGLVLSAIASAILIVCPLPSGAVGLESVELLPNGISAPQALKDMAGNQQKKLDAAEDSFKNSDTLKTLLERSEKNKKANAQAIANKYCYRQAELGIGDCGGLNYVPGMTKNGKQATPDWLAGLVGAKKQPAVEEGSSVIAELQGKTLEDLLGPVPDK